jgi:hypothetical protein
LHPFQPEDHDLLKAINRGEFTLAGFRNRDLQTLLYSKLSPDKAEQRRRSSRVSRQLRMLRAHHLIRKIARTHRYHVTDRGRTILSAILLAHNLTVANLLPVSHKILALGEELSRV